MIKKETHRIWPPRSSPKAERNLHGITDLHTENIFVFFVYVCIIMYLWCQINNVIISFTLPTSFVGSLFCHSSGSEFWSWGHKSTRALSPKVVANQWAQNIGHSIAYTVAPKPRLKCVNFTRWQPQMFPYKVLLTPSLGSFFNVVAKLQEDTRNFVGASTSKLPPRSFGGLANFRCPLTRIHLKRNYRHPTGTGFPDSDLWVQY